MVDSAVIVSGYFDPLHRGHLDYLDFARQHGHVFAIVNSDRQAREKKGRSFLDEDTRLEILLRLRPVQDAIISESVDQTVRQDIAELVPELQRRGYRYIFFANGGDRCSDLQVPESDTCRLLHVPMLYDTSGKVDSSRRILQDAGLHCERPWGWWRVLEDHPPHLKVKLLCVEPGKRISLQKHRNRAETWWTVSGQGRFHTSGLDFSAADYRSSIMGFNVRPGQWHCIENDGKEDLIVLEVQHGFECSEDDIERA